MNADVQPLYHDLLQRAASYGIKVREADLKDEVPGEFDGPTITLSRNYDAAERAFYLAHAVGSIVEWSLYFHRSRRTISELREAKNTRTDEVRLERALNAYLLFEQRTWESAVWLLTDIGHANFLGAFCNFARADMEAMRLFHSTGHAPIWRDFFSAWNEQVRTGQRVVSPLAGRPIPDFRVVKIPNQEIVQKERGVEASSRATECASPNDP